MELIYYKSKGKRKKGCVLAKIDGNKFGLGFSLYNEKLEKEAGVPFTKKKARMIASNRAAKWINENPEWIVQYKFPHSLKELGYKMIERCKKYMKKI